MAIEIVTYAAHVDDSLVAPWLDQLLNLGMKCELHPDFSFESQSGFLPIKLLNLRPTRGEFNNILFLSGFEFYVDKFDVEIEFPIVLPRRGLLNFFEKKAEEPNQRVNSEVDAKLLSCKWRLTFRFGSADVFELRLADLSSAILMNLTDGVRHIPEDSDWSIAPKLLHQIVEAVEEHERSLDVGTYQSHRFESWT
jgi:hypothetical protein